MAHDDFIFLGNIERFERKLKDLRSDGECKVLTELLAEERRRLEAARLARS